MRLTHEDGEHIAVELRIIYNGIQTGAAGEQVFFLFTDPATEGTFTAHDLTEARDKKEKQEEQWRLQRSHTQP